MSFCSETGTGYDGRFGGNTCLRLSHTPVLLLGLRWGIKKMLSCCDVIPYWFGDDSCVSETHSNSRFVGCFELVACWRRHLLSSVHFAVVIVRKARRTIIHRNMLQSLMYINLGARQRNPGGLFYSFHYGMPRNYTVLCFRHAYLRYQLIFLPQSAQ